MKLLTLFAFLSLFVGSSPAFKADDVIGTWVPSHGRGHVQIFKSGTKYYGNVVWLKEPNDPKTGKPKTDVMNPDTKLQAKPRLNLQVLKGVSFTGTDSWEGGTIYDPENGKTYSCYITMVDMNNLNLRGYVGFSMFGRTDTWKRVK
jgi:uncharacterized protein (DUF2147 family)